MGEQKTENPECFMFEKKRKINGAKYNQLEGAYITADDVASTIRPCDYPSHDQNPNASSDNRRRNAECGSAKLLSEMW